MFLAFRHSAGLFVMTPFLTVVALAPSLTRPLSATVQTAQSFPEG